MPIPHFNPKFGAFSGPEIKRRIQLVARALSDDPYLRLATTHAALALYDQARGARNANKQRQTKLEKDARGLKRASSDLKECIEYLHSSLSWEELLEIKQYADYELFRRIVLNQFDSAAHGMKFNLFLAILILYLSSRAADDPKFSNNSAYSAAKLFGVDEYLDILFSVDVVPEVLRFRFPRGHVGLDDLLREEFHFEYPNDPSIGSYFNVPNDSSVKKASFICYRYTTRTLFREGVTNTITKSLIEIDRPKDHSSVYRFSHIYVDTDGIVRITTGFVVRLAQAFYFIGDSRRGDSQFAIGIKIIAIPANETSTWRDHNFICGLFLSNDSALNPVVGRILLVRAGDAEDGTQDRYCGRIPDSELASHINANAAKSAQIRPGEESQLLAALRNIGQIQMLETSIVAFKRPE